MSAATANAEPTTRAKGRLPVVALVALVMVAGFTGLVLGDLAAGGSSPAVQPARPAVPLSHGGLRVQLPSGWARGGDATIAGFNRPLRVENRSQGVRAEVELLSAESPTLLPGALKKPEEAPDTVQLASGHEAWRYRKSAAVVYAIPTTVGIATIACSGEDRACEALASGVGVPQSRQFELDKNAAFFSRLPAVVASLDAARARGGEALGGATSAVSQAAAADELARAHKAAAATLTPLADGGVPKATVGSLTAAAGAYTALASAARTRSPRPYADAGRDVSAAEADLRRAIAKASSAVNGATRVVSPVKAAPAPKKQADPAPAKATPAPKASSGSADLTMPLLILVGLGMGAIAVRAVRRSLRAG